MTKLDSLKQRISEENWLRHLLALLGTIIGIVIALELDKRKEAQDEQDKLNGFLQLVDNELVMNQNRLTYFNRSHTLNLLTLDFATSKKRINRTFKCLVSQADSLFKRHPELADYIHEEKRIGHDSAVYTSNLSIQDDRDISFDSWDMIKNSGLMSELSPIIAFQYSEIYKSLRTNDYYNSKKLIEAIEVSQTDDKFSEGEISTMRDMIQTMKFLNEGKISSIKTGLDNIKRMKETAGSVRLIIDPQDSLKLKWDDSGN